MGRVYANSLGELGSILGHVIPKTLKWYLILPCLTLSIIKYVSRVKWSNPRKGVAPLPTPRCISYSQGSFLVALDYGRQHYLCSYYSLMNFAFTIRTTNVLNYFRNNMALFELVWRISSRIRFRCTFICARSEAMNNVLAHQLPQYYQTELERFPYSNCYGNAIYEPQNIWLDSVLTIYRDNMYLPTTSTNRMWHKVNFLTEFNRCKLSVFLLVDWLSNQS